MSGAMAISIINGGGKKAPTAYTIRYLAVGGGGGAGYTVGCRNGNCYNGAPGGGGGGIQSGTFVTAPGVLYSTTVGVGGNSIRYFGCGRNTTGGTSTLSGTGVSVSALGGGGATTGTGTSGGTGGGGYAAGIGGTGSQGGNGGRGGLAVGGGSAGGTAAGGGGGGGGGAHNSVGWNGGNGSTFDITGANVTYGGGGAGGGAGLGQTAISQGGAGGGGNSSLLKACSPAQNGVNNLGGGGGGKNSCTYETSTFSFPSGNGGNGVVILSMLTENYTGIVTGNTLVTTSGSNTIISYLSGSGSYRA